jgi:hypothetical protein
MLHIDGVAMCEVLMGWFARSESAMALDLWLCSVSGAAVSVPHMI